MTIIIRPMVEAFKKTIQRGSLVMNPLLPDDPEWDNPKKNTSVITWQKSRSSRVSSLTIICVFLTALFVFIAGFIGGANLYRQFMQNRLEHFRERCSIPYAVPMPQFFSSESVSEALDSRPSRLQSLNRNHEDITNNIVKSAFEKFFEEEFDIDTINNRFERIQVPDFSDGRRGRYIHDFAVNKTGIVDLDDNRCFVLPLNRSHVFPPQSLSDLVSKMRTGFYDVDTEIVRESYRIVTPPLSDLEPLGYYIAQECRNFPTYQLEKVASQAIVKRSTDQKEIKMVFTEFAGAKIAQVEIINLASIPSGEKKA